MPLPPRKFYTLQQAADKLSRDFKEPVTIEDLLHYWTFDNLKISVYCFEHPIIFKLGNLGFYKSENIVKCHICFENECPQKIDFDFFKFQNLNDRGSTIEEIFKITEDIVEKRTVEFEGLNYGLMCSGLFQILSNISIAENIKDIIDKGYLLSRSNINYLISPNQYNEELNEQIIIRFELEEDFYIDINHFYIMHYDLEQFINGNAKKINIDELINKPLRRDKQQNQANFIKALLQLHYGIEKPQDARNLLGLKGKLSKKFAAAGIECNISDNTLQNWLKDEF